MIRDVLSAKGLRAKLGHILRPPGWRPDGTGMTGDAIRAKWEADRGGCSTEAGLETGARTA